MRCSAVRDRFSPYFDGALDAGRQARMALHLEGCADCAGRWRAYREGLAFLDRGLAALADSPVSARQIADAARSRRYAEALVPAFSLRGAAIAWGLPLAAVLWFGWRVSGSILGTVVSTRPGEIDAALTALAFHAALWSLLYVALALGTHALFFTADLVAVTRGLWVLRGRPALALVGDPRVLQCLGVSLFGYAFLAARWYGASIF